MASIKLAMAATATNPVVGDLYLEGGTDRLTASLSEEVQQLLWTRFRFFQGEWFLDPTLGVPWYQSILGVKNSDDNVASVLRRVITTCPGVATLSQFKLNRVGRTISPTFSCTLDDGTTLTSADFQPFVIAAQ